MANEPPSGERRTHPLERGPVMPPRPPSAGEPPAPRQRVPLRMPVGRPTVTYALIAINIAVFVIRALSPALDQQFFVFGANLPRLVLEGGEYHRLVTAMFLHASLYGARDQIVLSNAMHIIFNMYILYAFGPQLERLFGHLRYTLVYLLGGLMGSVLSAVLGDPDIASVGASGAVFAIIAAEFVFLYRHRVLLGPPAQAQMRSLLIWGAINFAFGALTSVAGTRVRIDNWGHLGGMIGGLLLAWLLGPVFEPRPDPDTPAGLRVEDTNPLAPRAWVLGAYAVLVVALLWAGSLRFAA